MAPRLLRLLSGKLYATTAALLHVDRRQDCTKTRSEFSSNPAQNGVWFWYQRFFSSTSFWSFINPNLHSQRRGAASNIQVIARFKVAVFPFHSNKTKVASLALLTTYSTL
eukprot:8625671-Pyramimonas_sp.AAC.2